MNEHEQTRLDEIKHRIRDGEPSLEDEQWLVEKLIERDDTPTGDRPNS